MSTGIATWTVQVWAHSFNGVSTGKLYIELLIEPENKENYLCLFFRKEGGHVLEYLCQYSKPKVGWAVQSPC